MAKRIAVGAVAGVAWGAISPVVFIAMFGGLLPAPSGVAFPYAIGLFFLQFPFLVAGALETLLGRRAAALPELVVVSVAVGMMLGAGAVAVIGMARRGRRDSRPVRPDPANDPVGPV